MVWLQQLNGSIFCIFPATNTRGSDRVVEVALPSVIAETVTTIAMTFTALCASPDALWGLIPDGRLFVRRGMTSRCLTGTEWIQVDLTQLGESSLDVPFVEISHLRCFWYILSQW